MKIGFRYFSALVIGIACFATAALGQTASGPAPRAPLPFDVGETLTYEGKVSKIIQGISVAELTFTVKNKTPEGELLINAEARSKGTLVKLFGFSFLQVIDSTMRGSDLSALRTVKQDVQKSRIRNSEAVFDYSDRQVIYTETDPNEPMRPPRMIASDLNGRTFDLVSGIYHLRTLPLASGKTFNVTISDSGLIYNVPVRVTGRERLKTDIGRVWCFKIEPDVFGEGRMIEREGSMVIWITDDARRIPVRSQVKASFGKIDIKIQSVGNSLNSSEIQTAKSN
jgi:hypothetical protein